MGLGNTGVAVARRLLAERAEVRVLDRAAGVALPAEIRGAQWAPSVEADAALAGVEMVVPSPGVPASDRVLTRARELGIPVCSEIELAATRLEAPMVAVTGTNGKSTTTALIAHILGGQDAGVFAGGNLGTPLIEALGRRCRVVVVEVSSFQLEWVEAFRPRVGLLLNLSEDHLDRHGDIATYAAVKARMFARQGVGDLAILNRDDPRVAVLAGSLRCPVATFGRGPLEGGADGAVLHDDRLELRLGGRAGSYSLGR